MRICQRVLATGSVNGYSLPPGGPIVHVAGEQHSPGYRGAVQTASRLSHDYIQENRLQTCWIVRTRDHKRLQFVRGKRHKLVRTMLMQMAGDL